MRRNGSAHRVSERNANMGRPTGITIEEGVGPLGRALVALCRKRGCGVRALAATLGVPQASLYRMIQGVQPRAAQLAHLYQVCPALRPERGQKQ